jgi:hypothetical protein
MDDQTLQRFESNIDTSGDCWLWTGFKTKGYGKICINKKKHFAHRLMYILYNGTIPDGMVVRHTCRGKCVNPEHLEIGTQAENMKDMVRDGTSNRGERNIGAKLTADQVLEIRHRSNELQSELAKEFRVNIRTVYDIIRGTTWKHI